MNQRKPDGEHTGGRRKSENRQRRVIVSTRLTAAEFAPLALISERTGKPVARILREMILASSGGAS